MFVNISSCRRWDIMVFMLSTRRGENFVASGETAVKCKHATRAPIVGATVSICDPAIRRFPSVQDVVGDYAQQFFIGFLVKWGSGVLGRGKDDFAHSRGTDLRQWGD